MLVQSEKAVVFLYFIVITYCYLNKDPLEINTMYKLVQYQLMLQFARK